MTFNHVSSTNFPFFPEVFSTRYLHRQLPPSFSFGAALRTHSLAKCVQCKLTPDDPPNLTHCTLVHYSLLRFLVEKAF